MNKGCIFDLDGTILDTVYSIAHAVNATLKDLGLAEHEVEEYYHFAGDGQHELLKRALFASGDTTYQNLTKAEELYTDRFRTECTLGVKPFDGIVELLQGLKQLGYRLAVLSNKEDANVVHIIKTVFPKGCFDVVMGRRKEFPKKPDPAAVFHILEEENIAKESCLYVGDTDTDMKTGRNAGLYTIGVTWGFRDSLELEKGGADQIVSHPKEILDIAKTKEKN